MNPTYFGFSINWSLYLCKKMSYEYDFKFILQLAVLQENSKDKIANRVTDFYRHCSSKNVSIKLFIQFLSIHNVTINNIK